MQAVNNSEDGISAFMTSYLAVWLDLLGDWCDLFPAQHMHGFCPISWTATLIGHCRSGPRVSAVSFWIFFSSNSLSPFSSSSSSGGGVGFVFVFVPSFVGCYYSSYYFVVVVLSKREYNTITTVVGVSFGDW